MDHSVSAIECELASWMGLANPLWAARNAVHYCFRHSLGVYTQRGSLVLSQSLWKDSGLQMIGASELSCLSNEGRELWV